MGWPVASTSQQYGFYPCRLACDLFYSCYFGSPECHIPAWVSSLRPCFCWPHLGSGKRGLFHTWPYAFSDASDPYCQGSPFFIVGSLSVADPCSCKLPRL